METKKPTKSLNPYAPAFTPPSRSPPLFNFNKPFPCYNKPFKAITGAHVKPEKNPFVRYGFCHRRCLPPRLLKKPLPENKLAGRTSVMVKNIPNCLGKRANLGYAFVNFTSSLAAERFRREFENFSWDNIGFRKKICEITVAKYQGKEELTRHFRNSRFTCHTDDYLPVVLSPPSNGFTAYTLTKLGYRVGALGGGSRNASLR
ncbi:MEI2 C-terminal RRM only like 1 [Arabidopsis thaliana]|uniref:MEI2 C-terminal RRM only like 1 n=1 Tax=Arabidopsis thaliana TaxID=3702 RepID=Q1PFN8_ARATH|nr:MEI2 C-terminal RRM only like 1 [Arabidopsis thaliana]ABE65688.1 RNA-binding protein [Arabidopsis thaliana]AEE31893.1 MEI2 C-terminal RRM only like 1 [Arabidopsis thaliana]|eukprot:NP_001077670.1 MEI2 C-terminal RRM only like 1 [Arabidopsis thaliana]